VKFKSKYLFYVIEGISSFNIGSKQHLWLPSHANDRKIDNVILVYRFGSFPKVGWLDLPTVKNQTEQVRSNKAYNATVRVVGSVCAISAST